MVGPNEIATIGAALDLARPGDTVEVAPGEYHEDVHLKSGVSVVSTQLHGARIFSGDMAVSAENIQNARFVGFDIEGPGRVGIRIANSDLHVTEVRVSGMQTAGVEITGKGDSVMRLLTSQTIQARESMFMKTLAPTSITTSYATMDTAQRCCREFNRRFIRSHSRRKHR